MLTLSPFERKLFYADAPLTEADRGSLVRKYQLGVLFETSSAGARRTREGRSQLLAHCAIIAHSMFDRAMRAQVEGTRQRMAEEFDAERMAEMY